MGPVDTILRELIEAARTDGHTVAVRELTRLRTEYAAARRARRPAGPSLTRSEARPGRAAAPLAARGGVSGAGEPLELGDELV